MARGDGIHRTTARNARMKDADIGNAQAHNEREKSSYVNQDIVPERTPYNVHFKPPNVFYRVGASGSSSVSFGRSPFKSYPAFAGVELTKNLENAPVFAEQAETEAI